MLNDFEIRNKLGYMVMDNAFSNDTLIAAIAASLMDEGVSYNALERRLQCNDISSGVSFAATVGVRHEAVPRSSRMRLSVSIEAKHTLPSIRLSMTAYLRHATVGP